MARAADSDPEHCPGTAPFHAISIRSKRGIRLFPGRSTHPNWIARSAQASESQIVQAAAAILAIRKREARLREAIVGAGTGEEDYAVQDKSINDLST